ERRAGVGRLPDPTGRRGYEERARWTRDSHHARYSTGHVRGADVAPAEPGEQRRVQGDARLAGAGGGWWRCWWCGRCWRILRLCGDGDVTEDGNGRPRALEHDGS